jgi:hypothetical protein
MSKKEEHVCNFKMIRKIKIPESDEYIEIKHCNLKFFHIPHEDSCDGEENCILFKWRCKS